LRAQSPTSFIAKDSRRKSKDKTFPKRVAQIDFPLRSLQGNDLIFVKILLVVIVTPQGIKIADFALYGKRSSRKTAGTRCTSLRLEEEGDDNALSSTKGLNFERKRGGPAKDHPPMLRLLRKG
jgi:hypothetical protein